MYRYVFICIFIPSYYVWYKYQGTAIASVVTSGAASDGLSTLMKPAN